jgi:hypothetical protein
MTKRTITDERSPTSYLGQMHYLVMQQVSEVPQGCVS